MQVGPAGAGQREKVPPRTTGSAGNLGTTPRASPTRGRTDRALRLFGMADQLAHHALGHRLHRRPVTGDRQEIGMTAERIDHGPFDQTPKPPMVAMLQDGGMAGRRAAQRGHSDTGRCSSRRAIMRVTG